MNFPDALKKFSIGYLKLVITLAVFCAVMQVIAAWWHNVHLSLMEIVLLLFAALGMSVVAYVHRQRNRKPQERRDAHKSAERTPLMPRYGDHQ